jgi:serine/threonine protein kinase
MPVLWSAPESILEDHYDSKTDIWMLGQFIYEVFTHGCHPYTEVYRQNSIHIFSVSLAMNYLKRI